MGASTAAAANGRGIRPRIKSNEEVRAEVHRALIVLEGRCRAANYRME